MLLMATISSVSLTAPCSHGLFYAQVRSRVCPPAYVRSGFHKEKVLLGVVTCRVPWYFPVLGISSAAYDEGLFSRVTVGRI